MLSNCGVGDDLRVPCTARRSNQTILKEISPEYSLEGLMLKLKLQNFGYLMQKKWLIGKDPNDGKDWGKEEKGATEDEMVGWHHWLNGHEFEQTPGDSGGQGSLTCMLQSMRWQRVGHNLATEQEQQGKHEDVYSVDHSCHLIHIYCYCSISAYC